MMLRRLSNVRTIYPKPAMATRLLMVMLSMLAAQRGRVPISGGGKNTHKYPPTITPIGNAPATHAPNLCRLSTKMRLAAMRFASGPRITSGTPMKK